MEELTPIAETGYNDIAYMPTRGEPVTLTVNWETRYGALEPGSYGLVQDSPRSGRRTRNRRVRGSSYGSRERDAKTSPARERGEEEREGKLAGDSMGGTKARNVWT